MQIALFFFKSRLTTCLCWQRQIKSLNMIEFLHSCFAVVNGVYERKQVVRAEAEAINCQARQISILSSAPEIILLVLLLIKWL